MASYNVELRKRTGSTYGDVINVATDWSLIGNKPSTFVPLAHTHGNITDDGKIGTTSNVVVATTIGGLITTLSRNGIDSRTSFTPSSHASSAATYGLGSATVYGHVKTINALTQSSYANGDALSAYQGYLLNINKAPSSHASTGTTYGVGSDTAFGHLKVGEGIDVSTGVISLSNHGSAATIGSSTTLGIATHKNKTVLVTAGSACNITIPLNSSVAFPIGTHIDFVQEGAGEVTFVPASGVTMRSEGGKTKINAQYQAATLIKTATNIWYLIGAIK